MRAFQPTQLSKLAPGRRDQHPAKPRLPRRLQMGLRPQVYRERCRNPGTSTPFLSGILAFWSPWGQNCTRHRCGFLLGRERKSTLDEKELSTVAEPLLCQADPPWKWLALCGYTLWQYCNCSFSLFQIFNNNVEVRASQVSPTAEWALFLLSFSE